MRFNRAAVALLVLATAGLGACGDDDDDGISGVVIADFKGSWDASSIRYTSKADPNKSLDITSPGLNGDLLMNINADGTFSGTFKLPTQAGLQTIPITGKITLTGSNTAHVDLNWPAAVQNPPISDFNASFTLNGNSLQFRREDATFAFPQTPTTPEASILVIAMTRVSA